VYFSKQERAFRKTLCFRLHGWRLSDKFHGSICQHLTRYAVSPLGWQTSQSGVFIISLLGSGHFGRLSIQIETHEAQMSHYSLPEYCASSGLPAYFYTHFLVDNMEWSSWIGHLSGLATSPTLKIGNRIKWLPTEVRFKRILSLPRSDPVLELSRCMSDKSDQKSRRTYCAAHNGEKLHSNKIFTGFRHN